MKTPKAVDRKRSWASSWQLNSWKEMKFSLLSVEREEFTESSSFIIENTQPDE